MRRAMDEGGLETEGAPEATGANSEVPEAACSTGVPPATSFSSIAVKKNQPSSSDSFNVLKLNLHTVGETAKTTITS